VTRFASHILRWYSQNARDLPWRRRRDPYAIWISEVMLQQTRVETALPYFERWMVRFPSIRALAAASEQTVLKQWEGLGYYSRARSLRRAAQIIVRDHGGKIPSEVETLRRLPGVGAYTAAAVASIAFGKDEPALDGNIRRVLARVFNMRTPVGSPLAERRLRALSSQHLPKGRAADFNQALMDLGAVICLPRNPRCEACPMNDLCEAKRRGQQARLPVRARRGRLRRIFMGAAVISRQGQVLVSRRPSRGLLGGMWEFPKAEIPDPPGDVTGYRKRLPAAILGTLKLRVGQPQHLIEVRHEYSHFEVIVHAFHCSMGSRAMPQGFRWVRVNRLSRYPMGRVDRMIADSLKQDQG
jgi:A/G-specific adenine glycosylase